MYCFTNFPISSRPPAGYSQSVGRRHVVSRRLFGRVGGDVAVWPQAPHRLLESGRLCGAARALGLASGRIGNFINGELWGRVTDINAFWAMGFPQARYEDLTAAAHNPQWAAWLTQYGMLPRHPSQLYQFALEGVALFVIVWLFSKKPRPHRPSGDGVFSGLRLFRFIAEFARQPDDYLGLLTWGLSMGQWLSLPMVVLGIIGFIYFGIRGKAA